MTLGIPPPPPPLPFLLQLLQQLRPHVQHLSPAVGRVAEVTSHLRQVQVCVCRQVSREQSAALRECSDRSHRSPVGGASREAGSVPAESLTSAVTTSL